jgi:hypothetical protein
MKGLFNRWMVLAFFAVTACDEGPPPGVFEMGDLSATSPTSAAEAPVDTLATLRFSSSPEALWTEYQAIHAEAGPNNTQEIGRRIDGLMTDEARATIVNAVGDYRRAVQDVPALAHEEPDTVRFRALGESAVARRADIARYSLGPVNPTADGRALLPIYDGSRHVFNLPVARERGQWRFLVWDDLLASSEQLLPALRPRPDRQPLIHDSPESAAETLVRSLNGDDAWALYDLLDASTKTRLQSIVARLGFSKEEDLPRFLAIGIKRLRASHGTARVAWVTAPFSDHAHIILDYARGQRDTIPALRQSGTWRIRLEL